MEEPTKSKLYILDDDIHYANLLADVAINLGWEIEKIDKATTFLNVELPTVGTLVLDLKMPDMDGIEVIRALAKKTQHYH